MYLEAPEIISVQTLNVRIYFCHVTYALFPQFLASSKIQQLTNVSLQNSVFSY